MEYKVTKQHWGDKQYFEGDTREVKVKSDAEQLIKMGLIIDSDAAPLAESELAKKEKAEAAAKAKAEKEAAKHENKMAKEPANKSE